MDATIPVKSPLLCSPVKNWCVEEILQVYCSCHEGKVGLVGKQDYSSSLSDRKEKHLKDVWKCFQWSHWEWAGGAAVGSHRVGMSMSKRRNMEELEWWGADADGSQTKHRSTSQHRQTDGQWSNTEGSFSTEHHTDWGGGGFSPPRAANSNLLPRTPALHGFLHPGADLITYQRSCSS